MRLGSFPRGKYSRLNFNLLLLLFSQLVPWKVKIIKGGFLFLNELKELPKLKETLNSFECWILIN